MTSTRIAVPVGSLRADSLNRRLAEGLVASAPEGVELEIVDGHLTGRIVGEVVDRAGKADALREFAAEVGVDVASTIAIGDGANDVPMIRSAGLGIAYRGKPIARETALGLGNGTSGACIDHAGLTAALFMQGYRRSDFVT
mgnify:CR=1 FL=1